MVIPNPPKIFQIPPDQLIDSKNITPAEISETNKEILGLCLTMDYEITRIFTQNIVKPNPKYYIGRGKVEEIAEFIMENSSLEFVLFDCPLKPSQVFNLETKFKIRVIDRSTLILMIFLHHARTKEAKLQIEYAILNHQLPYVKELVRRSKLGEHPGLMAGGEYKVDDYYRLTRTRVKSIRYELGKIKISRAQQRKHRRRKGFVLVSLAGYTNAGKSCLLKSLTRANVHVDTRMFSTVSPKTRRFRDSKILFTDTVGFIRDIPTQLIEAFKSTLEEIIDADHIILLVDISDTPGVIKDKLKTCLSTIDQLVTERFTPDGKINKEYSFVSYSQSKPHLHLVFNKCDLAKDSKEKMENIVDDLADILSTQDISSIHQISCKSEFGIKELIEKLSEIEVEL